MIFRNGIRTTFRAKGRTALFFLLILVLTLSLTLGLGLYAYSSSALSAMDDQYMSIGLMEYMGEDYPDPDVAAPDARAAWEQIDAQAISQVDGVVAWAPQDGTLASVENYQRVDGTIPYEGWAVVTATGFYPITNAMGQTLYSARIVNTLYNQNDRGTMMMVDAGESGFEPEAGATYLLHGVFTSGSTSNPTLSLAEFDTGEPSFYKLSGDDDPMLTDSVFTQRAAYYAAANNYVRMTASDTPQALEEFHQGILSLREGRFPQAGETGVCVVDGQMAGQMDLELGDEIRLTVLDSDENDRFLLSENSASKALTVVGITSANVDWSGHVWVSEGEGGFSGAFFGYYLGEVVLENAIARQAAEALRAIVPEGVQITLYDQGYFTAAQPLRAMETTALAVAGASACGAVAVLVLFGSLFVGRQKETVGILRCLGTPSGKIRLWLLSGASVISASAALIGAAAGRLLMGTMIRWALNAAGNLYSVDQRYSESAIGTAISRNEIWELPLWPAIVSGLAVFGVSIIFCVLFLSQALDRSAPKKGKEKVRTPHGKTAAFGRGVLRYSPIFAVRSGGRSVIVVAASVILTLFLGILLSISQGWQSQMDQLYDTAKIQGRVTSTNGRQSTNLLVSENNVRLLWESGMLDEIGVSLGWHYWFPDEIPEFAQGGFGTETRNNWIAQQPQLTALNSLNAAPALYYEEEVAVEWLEGWDESCLSSSDYYPITDSLPGWSGNHAIEGRELLTYPCVVSTSFLKERGLSLGDSFMVMFQLPVGAASIDMPVQLQIVGSCAISGDEGIYVPLSFKIFPENLFGWDDVITAYDDGEGMETSYGDETEITDSESAAGDETGITDSESAADDASEAGSPNSGESYQTPFYGDTNFSTCRFTLSSARDLDAFRDYLEGNSISQAGKLGNNRMTIVVEDQSFVETVGGLGRLISFCRIVFPALFAAVCLLGFVISWLMTGSRRMEFAILRGLGTSGLRVFFTFFLEQGILCLSGSILGGLILMVAGCGAASWAAAGGFLVCYLAGCALSVLLIEQTKLMELLTKQE